MTEESRITWRMKGYRGSKGGIGSIKILWDPIRPDFESPCLPIVAVEHLNGPGGILSRGKENCAVSS